MSDFYEHRMADLEEANEKIKKLETQAGKDRIKLFEKYEGLAPLHKKIDALEEKHRMQMAAISVTSLCNTEKALNVNSVDLKSPYWSVGLLDVETAMKREIFLLKRVKELEEKLKEQHE